jgi:hypothetical protein
MRAPGPTAPRLPLSFQVLDAIMEQPDAQAYFVDCGGDGGGDLASISARLRGGSYYSNADAALADIQAKFESASGAGGPVAAAAARLAGLASTLARSQAPSVPSADAPRPGRCAACKAARKGGCGTADAAPKCQRRGLGPARAAPTHSSRPARAPPRAPAPLPAVDTAPTEEEREALVAGEALAARRVVAAAAAARADAAAAEAEQAKERLADARKLAAAAAARERAALAAAPFEPWSPEGAEPPRQRERVLALDPRTGAALFEARLAAPASVVAGEHPASAGLVAAAAAERWPAALETAR